MTKQELAEKAGCSRQHIEFILAGKRRPSKDLSERLEKVTGIKAEAWIFPERHRNPFLGIERGTRALGANDQNKGDTR